MSDLYGTNVAGKVVPFTTDDTYASHEDIYGQGGLMSVTDITERDAITTARRKEGMIVHVISENKKYTLSGGITNSDWIGLIQENTSSSAEIDENGLIGQPVYVKSGGHIALAKATTGYNKFVGLLTASVNSGFSGKYQCDGIFELDDWTNVTGSSALTPNNTYYLSDTFFGQLTNNPSTLTGFCAKIGIALSVTKLEIKNDINVLL